MQTARLEAMNENSGPQKLEALMKQEIGGLADSDSFGHIAALIDAAFEAGSSAGTDRAFVLLDDLEKRGPADRDAALLHYFRANAWENRRHERDDRDAWAWEQPEVQAQILELRRAARHAGFGQLPSVRQCQILTNLAGQLSGIGRFIEAIALWDRVLQIDERFAMAHGNRGIGLNSYANALYDAGHAGLMQVAAYDALAVATAVGAVYDSMGYEAARARFEELKEAIARHVGIDSVRQAVDVDEHSLGGTAEERAYRARCLRERLFINPLNDLGPLPIAAQDVLTLPNLTVTGASAGVPPVIGFFNQMKQEFVSARYLFYEGLQSEGPHFSDRGVLLYNTLDYPAYALAVEKMRAAFRIAYSLFDKIGFFLGAYLAIGRKPHQVSFRGIWYEPKGKKQVLLPRFAAHRNWPLRGLFWLSKDIFEEEFRRVTEPDAEDLAAIRNHLEHRYLQLHESLAGPVPAEDANDDGTEGLARALSRDEFAAKALRLLQLVRAALIYLSLAVHREESATSDSGGGGLVMPMPLDRWEDDWKS